MKKNITDQTDENMNFLSRKTKIKNNLRKEKSKKQYCSIKEKTKQKDIPM